MKRLDEMSPKSDREKRRDGSVPRRTKDGGLKYQSHLANRRDRQDTRSSMRQLEPGARTAPSHWAHEIEPALTVDETPAYRDPRASYSAARRSAAREIGGEREIRGALSARAWGKGSGYRAFGPNAPRDNVSAELGMPKFDKREAMDWDISDTPREPTRRPPPPHPGSPSRQPGKSPDQSKFRGKLPGVRQEGPFDSGGEVPQRNRARSQTSQFQVGPGTPLQKPGTQDSQALTGPGEFSWDVYVNGAGVYKVPASDEDSAKNRAMEWLNSGGDPDQHGKQFKSSDFQAVRSTGQEEGATAGGSLAGFQEPISDEVREAIREMVRARVSEIVRKKKGGGGYALYAPNKGKKKEPKPVGEFPTKTQAKEAELQRFPPRDPEQLKRARKRLEKLKKDPKKRIEKGKEDIMGRRMPKRGRKSAPKKPASTKEAIVRQMVRDLRERLFREEEIPGSPWDERMDSLHPDAISSDKKLHALHRGMEAASIGALGDGHKLMAKALRGIAKVHPGEHAFDSNRKKMYMPVHLDVGGAEVGPIHLYVDGGHVKIELSQDAREQIAGLEPPVAKNLRGGLMSLEEDHLPRIDRARKAWDDRDAYLDKIHGKLEKQIGGMSGVEAHLAKQLLQKHAKGKK